MLKIFALLFLLERDEGEYAYMGKLILDGIPPYKESYNMKLPGVYFMYALLMGILGKSITGVHLGLLVVNIATVILLFFSLKKLFNASVGLVTAAVYGIMSISPNLLGFAAHATHFVSLFAALGLFFYAKFTEKPSVLNAGLIGLMFGFSFLMKQQAVFFILFGGIIILAFYLLQKPVNFVQTAIGTVVYSLGVFIPYLLTLLIMYSTGVWDKFWFWTFEYASKYASGVSFTEGQMLFGMSFKPMWDEFTVFWLLAAAGIVVTLFSKLSVQQKIFAIGFALFSFLTVCPGFYFRQHYFIPFLPAVGLLAALSLDALFSWISSKTQGKLGMAPFIIVVLVSITAVVKSKAYYLKTKPETLSRLIYGTNPFLESVEIAKYVKENTTEQDKIAVLGSEPQIFLYADRASATGYIYTYGLMEIHDYNKKMQEEMIAEIEKSQPKFLVFCRVNTSWLARPGSPTLIFDWFQKYSQENYQLVGVADIVAQNYTNYKWGMEAATYQPQAQEFVLVYKKKGA